MRPSLHPTCPWHESFGNPASSRQSPVALRPVLTDGLPFREREPRYSPIGSCLDVLTPHLDERPSADNPREPPVVTRRRALLRDYDCVEPVRRAPRRGALQHFYRATARPNLDVGWSLSLRSRRRRASCTRRRARVAGDGPVPDTRAEGAAHEFPRAPSGPTAPIPQARACGLAAAASSAGRSRCHVRGQAAVAASR